MFDAIIVPHFYKKINYYFKKIYFLNRFVIDYLIKKLYNIDKIGDLYELTDLNYRNHR